MNVRLSTGRVVTIRISDTTPGFGATTYDSHLGKLTVAEAEEIAEAIVWSVKDSESGLMAEIAKLADE